MSVEGIDHGFSTLESKGVQKDSRGIERRSVNE